MNIITKDMSFDIADYFLISTPATRAHYLRTDMQYWKEYINIGHSDPYKYYKSVKHV